MIRAIIVDDDKDTVSLFSELLQSNNIQVVGTGYNGQDAAFLYQKLKPDIVFLDVIMPVYDGVYGLKKIREINEGPFSCFLLVLRGFIICSSGK